MKLPVLTKKEKNEGIHGHWEITNVAECKCKLIDALKYHKCAMYHKIKYQRTENWLTLDKYETYREIALKLLNHAKILRDEITKDATEYGFNIYKAEYYEYSKPELTDRTRQRLIQIANLGMKEIGLGDFGVKGVISGLYIEKVWSLSDEKFNEYMIWAKKTIAQENNELTT